MQPTPPHTFVVYCSSIVTILLSLLFTYVPLKTPDFNLQANSKNVDLFPVTFLRNYVTSSDVCADEVTCNRDALVRPQFA